MTCQTFSRGRNVMCFTSLVTRVGLACVGLAASVIPANAQGLERVTLRLNYLIAGYHTPFFLALSRGYFKERGIELQILEGKGTTLTIQAVGSNADTFGLADLASVAVAISRGIPLVAVGGLIQKNPDSIISLADSNIRVPRDVEGKRGAFVATGAGDRLFPAFAKANNIDLNKITSINVSAAARFSVLLQGNADFVVGWSLGDAYRINRLKPIAPPIQFSDNGVTMLGTGIFVTRETAVSRPQLVRNFLAAAAKGLQEAIANPTAAVASATKARPEVDPELLFVGMSGLAKYVRTTANVNMPLLAMAKPDWEETRNNLVNYLGMPGSMKSDAFYTNSFLPTQ